MKTEGPKLQCSDCNHIYLDVMWQDCCPKCRSEYSTEVSEDTELPDNVVMNVQSVTAEDDAYVHKKDFSHDSISTITEEEPERISHGIEQPIEFLNEDVDQRRDILAHKEPVSLVSDNDRLSNGNKNLPEDIPLVAINDTHNTSQRLDPELYPPSAKYASAERRRRKRRASGLDADNSQSQAVMQDALEKTNQTPTTDTHDDSEQISSDADTARSSRRRSRLSCDSSAEISETLTTEERPRRSRTRRLTQEESLDETDNVSTPEPKEETLESPRTSSRGPVIENNDEIESPRISRRRPVVDNNDEIESPRTSRRRPVVDNNDEIESPRTARRRPVMENDDEIESPRISRRRPVMENDDEIESPRISRRRPVMENDDEIESPRISRRRQVTDNDDEIESPRTARRRPITENADEIESPRRRRPITENEEEPASSMTRRRSISSQINDAEENDDQEIDAPVSKFSRRNRAAMEPMPETTGSFGKKGKETKEPKVKKEKEPKQKKGLFGKKVEEPQAVAPVRPRRTSLSGTSSSAVMDEDYEADSYEEELPPEKTNISESSGETSKFSRRTREMPQVPTEEPKKKGLFRKKS